MLLRTGVNGIVFYVSPLLRSIGVAHAFSTRIGGISPTPFDSLNLGNPNGCEVQDDYSRIWENYRRLQHAAGCDEAKPCRVHQVHGGAIARVEAGREFDTSAQADALVTDDPSRVLSVRVADCVPILLATEDGSAVAAVHAGWRGVIAGVAPRAVREMARDVSAVASCIAAIGPCIGFDAFEVGPEVAAAFEEKFPHDALVRQRPDGKATVDLRAAVKRQLIDSGVSAERIDLSDRCTYRDRQEFFSHRRDNGITGRMAAVIQCRH